MFTSRRDFPASEKPVLWGGKLQKIGQSRFRFQPVEISRQGSEYYSGQLFLKSFEHVKDNIEQIGIRANYTSKYILYYYYCYLVLKEI